MVRKSIYQELDADLYNNQLVTVVEKDEVEDYLIEMNFPKNRDELLQYAEDEIANPEVITALEQLPNVKYEAPQDVIAAMTENYSIVLV